MIVELIDALFASLPGPGLFERRAGELTFLTRYAATGFSLLVWFTLVIIGSGARDLIGKNLLSALFVFALVAALGVIIYFFALFAAAAWEQRHEGWKERHVRRFSSKHDFCLFTVTGGSFLTLLLGIVALLNRFPHLNDAGLWRNSLLIAAGLLAFLIGWYLLLKLDEKEVGERVRK